MIHQDVAKFLNPKPDDHAAQSAYDRENNRNEPESTIVLLALQAALAKPAPATRKLPRYAETQVEGGGDGRIESHAGRWE